MVKGKYVCLPPTSRSKLTVRMKPPPLPVMGRVYHRPGTSTEPVWVSVTVRVAVVPEVMAVGSNAKIR